MSKLKHLSKMSKVHFISFVCVCELSIHDFFLLFISFSLCSLFLKVLYILELSVLYL